MIGTEPIEITRSAQSRIKEVDFSNIKFGREFSDHMFIADYKNGRWQDMRIVPYGALSLTPAVSALHYGQSIFEGLKAYRTDDGHIMLFRPYDNLERMKASARRMCMPEVNEEIFIEGMKRLVELDQEWVPKEAESSLYIRPFLFATDEYVGIRPSDSYKFIIFCCPVGNYYNEPVRVKVEQQYSRSFPGGTGAAKTAGNYAAALFPAKQAQDKGYHQLVWTDALSHSYFEESGTMNVFFLIDDKIITPPVSETILKGVTRDSVIKLARHWGKIVEERPVSVAEVEEAIKSGRLQEAFGAGTAATIAHIALMNIQGKDYTLPEISSREFSAKVLHTLESIKRGRMEDTFGWTMKI